MADKKITQLDPITTAAEGNDLFAIVDIDQDETKKISKFNLFAAPGPIGSNIPSTGEFTTLQLPAGSTITEFSIDGTLAGNSDLAVPTEKAVKTYVDAQVGTVNEHDELLGLQGGDSTAGEFYHLTLSQHSGLTDGGLTDLHTHSGLGVDHNILDNLQGGDSTAIEFYHLTQQIHDSLYSASPIIGLGSQSGTNFEVDFGNHIITVSPSGNERVNIQNTVQTIGQAANGVNMILSQASDNVSIYMDAGEGQGYNQVIDIDGDSGNSEINIGLQTEVYLKVTIGSAPKIRMISGTDTWFYVDPSEQRLGNVGAGESRVEVESGGDVFVVAQGTQEALFDTNGLTLKSGASVNEFSIDGTLAGDSDDAVPTEQAVKTYVDAQISGVDEHNELLGLQGGDATAVEFYHLTQSIHDGLFSASPIIGLGSSSGTNIQVDYGSDIINMNISGGDLLSMTPGNFEVTTSGSKVIDVHGGDGLIDIGPAGGVRFRVDYGDDREIWMQDQDGFIVFEVDGTTLSGHVDLGRGSPGVGAEIIVNYGSNTNNILHKIKGVDLLTLEEGIVTIDGDTHITGDLTIDGTSTIINTIILEVEDNVILVNKGEQGSGVTEGVAGIRVDRGSLTDYRFIFDESDDYFKVGELGSEKRVALYEDLTSNVIVGNEALSNGDTTASITFLVAQSDADYGVAWSLVNTVDSPPSIYAGTVFEKIIDGFSVILSGPMDTDNYVLSWIVTR